MEEEAEEEPAPKVAKVKGAAKVEEEAVAEADELGHTGPNADKRDQRESRAE